MPAEAVPTRPLGSGLRRGAAALLLLLGCGVALLSLAELSSHSPLRPYHILRSSAVSVDKAATLEISGAADGGLDQHFSLCVMTRVKNQASIISEWIEYHKEGGVDHFFIADGKCCTHHESPHRGDRHPGRGRTPSDR